MELGARRIIKMACFPAILQIQNHGVWNKELNKAPERQIWNLLDPIWSRAKGLEVAFSIRGRELCAGIIIRASFAIHEIEWTTER